MTMGGDSGVPTGERLDQFVATADLAGLEQWLVTASAEQLAEARSWYAATRPGLRRRLAYGSEIWDALSDDQRSDLPWVRALLAVGLEGPKQAAAHVPWGEFWHRDAEERQRQFRRVATWRGEKWVQVFVPAAAAVRSSAVFALLSPLVLEFGLPCPDGEGFLDGWLPGYWWCDDEDAAFQRLVDDPLMPEVFHHLVGSGQLGRVSDAVPGAAARLVEKGLLDRARVVAQSFDLLTTPPPVATQRALVRLLRSLDVTTDEIPGGLPFIQGLVATCHGSVGAWLLPTALRLVETAEELAELTGTVAGRPERAQKSTLLRALADDAFQSRIGREPVLSALAVLSESSEDQKFRARVAAVAATLGREPAPAETGPEPVGLWDLTPPGERFVAPRVGEWPGMTKEVRRGLASELMGWAGDRGVRGTVHPDLYLAAVVLQAAKSGAPAVRKALEAGVEQGTEARECLGEAIVDWIADPGLNSYRAAHQRAGAPRFTKDHWLARPYSLNVPGSAFRYLLARESLLRLGRTPELLSTPSHADHSISFEVLAQRITRCQGASVGPMDLLQTLLRLRPTDPDELAALDGMSLPVDDIVSPTEQPLGVPDGVEALRSWVMAGGLPPLEPYVENVDSAPGGWRWTSDAVLPIPTGLLALAPRGFLNDDPLRYRSDEVIRVVPGWPDCCLWSGYDDRPERLRAVLLEREALPDLVAYRLLLNSLVSTVAKTREETARIGLELMGEGRFDTDRFGRVAVARLEAGTLPLARVAGVWELMTTAGGLRQLWPAMLRVAESACAATPRPAGTADLLRMLTRLAPEVPEPGIPPAVRALAEGKGSTKAHHEARAFVAAMDRRRVA